MEAAEAALEAKTSEHDKLKQEHSLREAMISSLQKQYADLENKLQGKSLSGLGIVALPCTSLTLVNHASNH